MGSEFQIFTTAPDLLHSESNAARDDHFDIAALHENFVYENSKV